jgi:hypothetical protein
MIAATINSTTLVEQPHHSRLTMSAKTANMPTASLSG